MNEIMMAPCDVISKIKQNSSHMNEIILAPCDAGYVQSCTGFILNPIIEFRSLRKVMMVTNAIVDIYGIHKVEKLW
jgi:hypothetical protein